jgi:ribosomal protein S18 acetylase RimI-like enzyme
MMMLIRPAHPEDVTELRQLGSASWWNTYSNLMSEEQIQDALDHLWSEEYLAKTILSSRHITLVAESTGHLAAYSECETHIGELAETLGIHGLTVNSAILWKMYVRRDHQRSGIGLRMMARVLSLLPEHTDALFVEYVRGNEPARRFYEAAGFGFYAVQEPQIQSGVAAVWMKMKIRE